MLENKITHCDNSHIEPCKDKNTHTQLTQRECEEEQRECDQVESCLLIDLSDGVDRHGDEQGDTGECGTLQKRQQDCREQEISTVHHTHPDGTQTQT